MSTFKGTSGDDNLSGTGSDDQFNLIQGGEDTASGAGGNDTFVMHATLDAGDAIDGGTGSDTVTLAGDYSAGVTFTDTTITNVERILLGAGFDYTLTSADATVAAGQSLTVDGAHLGAGDVLNFDGSAETDGKLTLVGGAGDDVLKGGSAGAAFDLRAGGEDIATGGSGSDLFVVGANLDAGDKIDGGFSFGGAHDVLRIVGDYSAGLTFGADTIQNIDTLQLGAGFSYNFTVDNNNFLSGPTVLVRADGLGAGNSLTFDASASDAGFHFIAGAGNDVITGSTAASIYDLSKGGNDTVHGGALADRFDMGTTFNASDNIDGGGGDDRVDITGMDGVDAVLFTPTTMTNVETLVLGAGHSYTLVTDDATVAAGATMLINGAYLGAGDNLEFDGSAETAGHFTIRGGAGDDTLTGGAQADVFNLKFNGADTATGNGGDDRFDIGAAWDSDDVIDGGAGNDTVTLAGDYGASGSAFTIFVTMLQNVETLTLGGGNDYYLETFGSPVASGQSLAVDASTLTASDIVQFDASTDVGARFTFEMGGGFTAADKFTGSNLGDTLVLDGDYSAGLTLGAATITSVEEIDVTDGHSYKITTDDGNVASGATLTIDAGALTGSNALTFDGSAETDGHFAITGGAGNDSLTGGAQADTFDLSAGGADTAQGGGGNDTFFMGNILPGSDTIDGGSGTNALEFAASGTLSGSFGNSNISNIQTFTFDDTGSYDISFLTFNSANPFTVDGSALTAGHSLTFSANSIIAFTMTGGAGDDDLSGGDGADTFDLTHGGNDTVSGGQGNDTIDFGAALTAADSANGGGGSDTLNLDGDYSAGLTFGASTITSVETLKLGDGFSYKLTTNDGNVASSATMAVDASALTGTNKLTFDGSAENGGFYAITGGAGDDSVTYGVHFSASDSFDGGAGNDTLILNNINNTVDHITFTAATLTNVENLVINTRYAVNISTNDANVAAGATLTVDASGFLSNNSSAFTFDGSAETDGHFAFICPPDAYYVSITGGALSDTFALGIDGTPLTYLYGGGGDDTFTVSAVGYVGAHFDGGSGNDTLSLTGGGTAPIYEFVLASIETLRLDDNDWTLTASDDYVASGATLTVDATALTAAHTLAFDGSGETDGNFAFTFAGGFTASDGITGGAGNDTLSLDGDYSGGVTFGASTISSVEKIVLAGGHTYGLTTDDANIASGATLTVDASALGSGDQLFFGGANEADGHFAFISGAGADDLEGGAQSDTFDLTLADGAFVYGNGGNDTFTVTTRAHLLDDSINGGSGTDTLILDGDFSTQTAMTGSNLTSIDALTLLGGTNSYNLTFAGGITTALTVDASAAASLTFDASGATTTTFTITGSGGDDSISFGANFTAADTIDGGAGNDTLTLDGATTVTMAASTITNIETIAFDAGFNYSLTENDGNVASGQTLTVDASALGASDVLTFNGAAETDGSFDFIGGAGADVLTGGAQADTFDVTRGSGATVTGNGGNDLIQLGTDLNAVSSADGGAGTDTVEFGGDYIADDGFAANVYLYATQFKHIENVKIDASNGLGQVSFQGDLTTGGGTLTVDASAVGAGHNLDFVLSSTTTSVIGVTSGAGNDSFDFTGNFHATDALNGGAGNDTVTLNGNTYSSPVTLGAGTFTSIETLRFVSTFAYSFISNDANVAAGATLTVDAGSVTSSGSLTFNGAAETDGSFAFIGSAGNDVLTGGTGADSFDLTKGGNDNAVGNAGDDTFYFGSTLTTSDHVDGVSGNDTVNLAASGTFTLNFNDGSVERISKFALQDTGSYNLTYATEDFSPNVTVDGSALTVGHTLTFTGTAGLSGTYNMIGGADNDTLTGSANNDSFNLTQGGDDTTSGGAGNDTFSFGAAFTAADTVNGGANTDTISLNGDYSAGLVFGATTMTSVENIVVQAGHDYNLTTNDANVASAATLTITATSLGAGDSLTFDGSAETDGHFAITGGAGDDAVTLASRTVFLSGTFNGGAGNDTLTLNGNFSTSTTLTSATVTNVEKIVFDAATTNYSFISNDGNVASGQTLTLDGSALTHSLLWDGSAETDGFFDFIGGAGNDTFTVGSATVLAGSTADGGGGGNNFLVLNGDYSAGFTFTAAEMTNFQNLTLDRNHSYNLTTIDANVAGGAHLNVSALALVSTDSLTFNGAAETDGTFTISGGQGHDVLTGGAGNDTIFGYLGADTMTGGAGADTFSYTFAVGSGVAESTSTGYDTITDIDFSTDKIDPPGANGIVTGVDTAIVGGALSTATFDTDLAAAVNAGNLAVSHAVLFTADSGTLSGHTFLVVDENGTAGYQASADLVIDVTNYTGTLSTSSFV